MTTPLDDHTLNACLARVIGVEIRDRLQDFILPKWVAVKTGEYWEPLQNASQMEEVEAWLVEQGYCIEYQHLSQLDCLYRITPGQMDDLRSWTARDPDKKRAFALAIWEMEQARKETT